MAKSKASLEGWLLVDHRESPGVPVEMLVAAGLPPEMSRGRYESAVLTCCHCNTGIIVNPMRTRPRNHCRKCDAYVCDSPGCNADCLPFAKVLDDAETEIVRGQLLLGG